MRGVVRFTITLALVPLFVGPMIKLGSWLQERYLICEHQEETESSILPSSELPSAPVPLPEQEFVSVTCKTKKAEPVADLTLGALFLFLAISIAQFFVGTLDNCLRLGIWTASWIIQKVIHGRTH